MQINIFITVVTIIFILLILLIIYGSTVPIGNIMDRITNKLELLSGFFIGCGVILTVFIFNISDIEARKNITLNNNYSKCPNFITPFSVKSGTPRTPKKRNCTHKSVIILDPINYQLLIICLVNFISVGLLSFIKLKDLLYLKGLSLNFM